MLRCSPNFLYEITCRKTNTQFVLDFFLLFVFEILFFNNHHFLKSEEFNINLIEYQNFRAILED